MRHLLNISKRHQNTFNLDLSSKNKNSNNNRRIKSLMFKIVCKTPLFTKNSTTSWISCITGTFYVIPRWTPLLNTICQISTLFQRRGALIWGRCSLNISCQRGSSFEGGTLSSLGALSIKYCMQMDFTSSSVFVFVLNMFGCYVTF